MQRLLIAVLTVLVFCAGFLARVWTENSRPVPPPPVALGSEFNRPAPARPAEPKVGGQRTATPVREHDPAINRATLISDIEKARPQIEAYRKRLDALDAEFDRELLAILTPEQREKYIARQKRYAERRTSREAREAADASPLSDEQILRLQQIPLFNVLWTATITSRLDRLDRDLKLDAAQRAKSRELLVSRRDKFLALVDAAPPPTITLSLLASRVPKLGEPPPPKK